MEIDRTKIGLVYGSDTGATEEITHAIVQKCEFWEIDVQAVSKIDTSYFEQYDFIILGLSTWYDGDLQSDWEDFFEDFKTVDFTNKIIAIFGLGDQFGYDDYFIDGVGMLAEFVLKNGGRIIGHWPSEDYDFSASKASVDQDTFYGLALDEDNESHASEERIDRWTKQLHTELSDLSPYGQRVKTGNYRDNREKKLQAQEPKDKLM